MIKEKIKQLKILLDEMDEPSPGEFNQITRIFNEYKKKHETNFVPGTIDHHSLIYFIADKFRDWEFLRQIRDLSKDANVRTAASGVLMGYFVEMVKAIKMNDLFGWVHAGFDISKEEFEILEAFRHTKFHVPDNIDLFVKRSERFTGLKRVFQITLRNSGAIKKYFEYYRGIYPDVDIMLERAFAPSRNPFFMQENFKIASLKVLVQA